MSISIDSITFSIDESILFPHIVFSTSFKYNFNLEAIILIKGVIRYNNKTIGFVEHSINGTSDKNFPIRVLNSSNKENSAKNISSQNYNINLQLNERVYEYLKNESNKIYNGNVELNFQLSLGCIKSIGEPKNFIYEDFLVYNEYVVPKILKIPISDWQELISKLISLFDR